MSWRDQLRPASFRGVPFFVRGHELTGGRRGELHEFPFQDVPFAEDLGLRARGYEVEGYVLGDDYMAKRDALLRALETPGPGALVHPYLGRQEVALIGRGGYRMRERAREGRIARFSMYFTQAGANRFPAATIDTKAAVTAQAEAAGATAEEVFVEDFDAGNKPAYILEAASALIVEVAEEIGAIADAVVAQVDALPDFERDLLFLRGNVASLITTPAVVASRVRRQIEALVNFGPDLFQTFELLGDLGLFGLGKNEVPAGTANRSVQAANQEAVFALTRRSAAVASAQAAAGMSFESRDAALAVRDEMADRLGTEALAAGDAGDDAVYTALSELRAAVVRDLNARGARLPVLRRFTPVATLPALALAHVLNGADPRQVPAQAEALARRNRVRHPGFVPGGVELEVPLS